MNNIEIHKKLESRWPWRKRWIVEVYSESQYPGFGKQVRARDTKSGHTERATKHFSQIGFQNPDLVPLYAHELARKAFHMIITGEL